VSFYFYKYVQYEADADNLQSTVLPDINNFQQNAFHVKYK